MPEVHVSLDTSVVPPVVTCKPQHLPVDHGNQPISWLPAPHQDFTFPEGALTGLPNPPFSSPSIGDHQITVGDNNQNSGPQVAYPYTLCVEYEGQTYCTGANSKAGNGNPTVDNR